jgi:hypothetical protein
LALPRGHPRRRLLLAFYEWWCLSVGREIPWEGREDEALDLAWFSPAERKTVRFSAVAYELLCHLSNLFESWHVRRPWYPPAESDRRMREHLPVLRRRLSEARKQPGAREGEMRDLLRRTGELERLIREALAAR